MSWTDSQIESLITFYSSVLVSGARNFATGVKNRFLAPVSGACVMGITASFCRSSLPGRFPVFTTGEVKVITGVLAAFPAVATDSIAHPGLHFWGINLTQIIQCESIKNKPLESCP